MASKMRKDIGAVLIHKSSKSVCKIISIEQDKYILQFEDGTQKAYTHSTINGKFDLYKGDFIPTAQQIVSVSQEVDPNQISIEQISNDIVSTNAEIVQLISVDDTADGTASQPDIQFVMEENAILKRYLNKLEDENRQVPALLDRIAELENAIRKLKATSTKGRKPKFTILDIEKMKDEIDKGKTYKQVADMFKCSSPFVFNCVKKYRADKQI